MKSNALIINFELVFLYFAVVIIPIAFFKDPSNIKVDPYLFYKSKEIPAILQSWKKVLTCLSENPKWRM